MKNLIFRKSSYRQKSNLIFIKSSFSLKLDFLKIEFQNRGILLLALGERGKCQFWPHKKESILSNTISLCTSRKHKGWINKREVLLILRYFNITQSVKHAHHYSLFHSLLFLFPYTFVFCFCTCTCWMLDKYRRKSYIEENQPILHFKDKETH